MSKAEKLAGSLEVKKNSRDVLMIIVSVRRSYYLHFTAKAADVLA